MNNSTQDQAHKHALNEGTCHYQGHFFLSSSKYIIDKHCHLPPTTHSMRIWSVMLSTKCWSTPLTCNFFFSCGGPSGTSPLSGCLFWWNHNQTLGSQYKVLHCFTMPCSGQCKYSLGIWLASAMKSMNPFGFPQVSWPPLEKKNNKQQKPTNRQLHVQCL